MLLLIGFFHNSLIVFLSFFYFSILILIFLPLKIKGKGYFVGIQELCGCIYSTKFALNYCGFDDVTAMGIVGFFDKNNLYDYTIKIPEWLNQYPNLRKYWVFFQKAFYLPKFLYGKENFIFFWNCTFLPVNLDLVLLKILRKKIVIFHCGDDVRYRPIHNKLMKMEGMEYCFPSLNEMFPTLVFLQKLFYQKFPSYLRIPIYTLMNMETFLDDGAYYFRLCQKDFLAPDKKINNIVPLIVHAPSHRELKGTKIVLDAIEILRAQNVKFDFLLLENKTNDEVIKILKTADIVIDQPGLWGRLAMEGMAHSCIVFGGFNPQYENTNWNLPIFPFNRDPIELANNIRKTLQNIRSKDLRNKFFKAYKDYYSAEAFVSHLNNVLSGKIEKELFPHPNHKEKLLSAAENLFQRFMIKLFIK
ncbi:MAG: hypothetical protein WCG05_04010 [Alphaproteobacteria bacterium]